MRWDGGRALSGVDLDELVSRFTVRYVPAELLGGGDVAGINCHTTLGRELGCPRDEVWLAEDMRDLEPFLLLHEAVEMHLRDEGWLYGPSHEYAELVVEHLMGDHPDYEEYVTMEHHQLDDQEGR